MTLLCCSWRLRDTFHLVDNGAAQPIVLLREKYRTGLFQDKFFMSPVPAPHRGPTGAIAQTMSPPACCHSPVKPWSTCSGGSLTCPFWAQSPRALSSGESGTVINAENRGTPQRRTPRPRAKALTLHPTGHLTWNRPSPHLESLQRQSREVGRRGGPGRK